MSGARLKGTASGVVVDLAAASSPDEALVMLDAALAENGAFLSGARLTIDIPEAALVDTTVQAVLAACGRHGVEAAAITSDGRSLYTSGPAVQRIVAPGREASAEVVTSPEIASGECGVVVGTVRSGHAVRHPGNIIVFGDVNAGAEIVAGQSVVVWGALRGTVQAGATGDAAAVVCALSLTPTQLRIDGYIARAPDGPAPEREPEMARVQNGAIVVEAWSSRRSRQPGVPAGRVYRAIGEALHRVLKGVR